MAGSKMERARLVWRCQVGVLAFLAAFAVGLQPGAVQAQRGQSVDGAPLQVSRAELEQLVKQLEQTAQSGSYSAELRQQARQQAEAVNRRLREGDFQVGDQVQLVIEGEQAIPPLTVARGRVLIIPNLGEMTLEGVLRSELTAKVTEHVARYIRDPVVRAQSLIRLAVTGAIGKPGFHWIAAETPLPDALMLAGGPVSGAKLDNLRIERGGERIWEDDSLQRALAEGQTLDQMSLRSGDEIMLPSSADTGSGRLMRILTIASGVVVGLVAVLRGF